MGVIIRVTEKLLHGFVFSWPAVISLSLLILILSVAPLDPSRQVNIIFFDKIIHAFSYCLLSFITVNTFSKNNLRRPRLSGFLYAFLLGFAIEMIQVCIPYRDFEFADITANFLGSLLGSLLKFA
jgi:VanZ family protein